MSILQIIERRREQMKQKHSWEITDEFWVAAQPLIPRKRCDPMGEYQWKPGGGRLLIELCTTLVAIFSVLRTGIQRKTRTRCFRRIKRHTPVFPLVG